MSSLLSPKKQCQLCLLKPPLYNYIQLYIQAITVVPHFVVFKSMFYISNRLLIFLHWVWIYKQKKEKGSVFPSYSIAPTGWKLQDASTGSSCIRQSLLIYIGSSLAGLDTCLWPGSWPWACFWLVSPPYSSVEVSSDSKGLNGTA